MTDFSPQIFDAFGLVYTEIDNHSNPIIRASYPTYDPDINKVILLRSIPYGGVEGRTDMFSAFQIDSDHLGVSFYKYFSRARTLTGSPVACLTWVTKVVLNPLILKPFLEILLHPLLRVKVDREILKILVQELKEGKGKIKMDRKHSNISLRFSVKIPEELPEYYEELERDLSKL